MKENQIEFVFIGVIIIVFAIWKISELIKTRCYQAKVIREGFDADVRRAKKAEEDAASAAKAKPELITRLTELFQNSNTPVLSTENFTVDTSENDMTVNQRKKAATMLDTMVVTTPAPTPTPTPTQTVPVVSDTNTVKEGLENPDENTKEFIDKNITSINPDDSQSKFKLRD
jgi:Na+-transporting methylmalonyl-CoA/oxaloacetate decarboxylase gamma subunit